MPQSSQSKKQSIMNRIKPHLSDNSLEIVKKRYLKIDEAGKPVETEAEMFYRVARAMAEADAVFDKKADIDKTTEEFYSILANLEFLPGGRVLFEAGNNHTGQLASCFVVPIDDSLNGIFDSLKNAAIIQKNNGGTGFNFSKIRPKGASVKGVPNVAAGPIHYIRTFDRALSEVMQGSKRHGANMGILNINHPDIMEFINLKDSGEGLKNFNISVGVNADFMEKVRLDQEYDLINPATGKSVKKLRAREVFDIITKKAWECGDPGMIFLDQIEAQNYTPNLGQMVATNPCGEQPLLPYESCNLGSVVLPTHAKDGKVDWVRLKKTVHTVIHFMDNMIEVNNYPLLIIRENVLKTRKIGLGVLGFAQLLYKLNIPYTSDKAVGLAEKVVQFVQEEGRKASMDLAKKRGVFPGWKGSVYEKMKLKMRNATITTIAPNGTISLVADCASGVEPVFSLVISRKVFFEDTNNKDGGKTLIIVDPVFEAVAKKRGFYSKPLMEEIAQAGSLHGIKGVPEDVKKVFVTSHDISYDWHVKIQAAAQRYTDNAVSKTINFPNSATVSDVSRAYILAYELGCKGITIYRDGSKNSQVLNVGNGEKKEKEEKTAEPVIENEAIPSDTAMLVMDEVTTLVPPLVTIHNDANVFTENALKVLERRALRKDKNGKVIETPEQLFKRIAKVIASADKGYKYSASEIKKLEEEFYDIMSSLKFISGQALRNTDSKHLTFSACFVLPVEDSMEKIFDSIKENVLVHKATGGTGMNFSHLRSRNAMVGSSGEVASGPITFMKAFDAALETIRTKGGRKQGAMAILSVEHPDIEEFIGSKDDGKSLINFNISVGITDNFMKALEKDEEFSLIDPHTKQTVKRIRAKKIFDMLAEHAWKTGDPGVIFLDNIERDNPTPKIGKLESTNPCGEQPLLPYESCNLGSVVLSNVVKRNEKGQFEVDYKELGRVTKLAIHFLDNTIDLNNFPVAKIEQMTKANRKIGLGVMGFADLLVKLEIPYNSEEAVKLAEKIMKFIAGKCQEASSEIAKKKGSFLNFKESAWRKKGFKYFRNATTTTIAPTGYTSIVANCSSGVEPIFALAYRREQSMGGVDQIEVNSYFEEVAKREGFYSEELMKKILEKGSVHGLSEVPEKWQKVFVVSHDIDPQWDLKIQAAFQKYTDNAVSKTINFPENATKEDIAKVYKLAYELNCKGITVYRNGSKDTQVLHVGTTDKDKKEQSKSLTTVDVTSLAHAITPRPRPNIVRGSTYRIKTGYGNLYVTVNDDEKGYPFEVFATIGKNGGFFAAKSESICRLISLTLRSGVKVEEVIKELKGIRGPSPAWGEKGMVLSIPDAIAQILEDHIKREQQPLGLFDAPKDEDNAPKTPESTEVMNQIDEPKNVAEDKIQPADVLSPKEEVPKQEAVPVVNTPSKRSLADIGLAPQCPDCGGMLEFGEGCVMCRGCGYSRCG